MKVKKVLRSEAFWTFQVFLFGLVLGIPFFMNGKAFIAFIRGLSVWQVMLALLAAFFMGYFVEAYGKKSKLFGGR